MDERVAVALRGGGVEKTGVVPGCDFEGFLSTRGAYAQSLDAEAEIFRGAGGRSEIEYVVHRAGIEGLADVFLRKFEARLMGKVGQVFSVAGREVVNAENGVSFGQESIGEVGAEKSGSAGNKNTHSIESTLPDWRPD
jgi:hypothetical protein